MGTEVRAGSLEELRSEGCITTKAGSQPVCVFWYEGKAFALDDRCPHMGFPLHRGTVESGLLTCHWHHARFDLSSGGTLDPFADDVRTYPVELRGNDVFVVIEPESDRDAHHLARLREGLEQGLTLVIAKAVLALVAGQARDATEDAPPALASRDSRARDVVRVGVEFGTTHRAQGWGAGLTVLVAMANVLDDLATEDRALALVHGLAFVSRDTRNHPPRFPLTPLVPTGASVQRLSDWYRRFVDTRSSDAAERTLLSAIPANGSEDPGAPCSGRSDTNASDVSRMMTAAVTDHVFLDGGHTIDFTNKAFEALGHLGPGMAGGVLPTLVAGTVGAGRAEESGQWRHPDNLVNLVDDGCSRLPRLLAEGESRRSSSSLTDGEVAALSWDILGDDPREVLEAICEAIAAGMSPEQLGRAVAYAAALRIVRFHVQNDHADWDVVHHGFTAANALHQCLVRAPSEELMRGLFHSAFKVYLDRFLNVPAARPPSARSGDLDALRPCFDEQGGVDESGNIAYGYLKGGGDPAGLIATLGHALLSEDAEFHWFQTYEAALRQFDAWPRGSEEGALILAGAARFLAAHTPTRRELTQVVRIASRLRRGEPLYEDG